MDDVRKYGETQHMPFIVKEHEDLPGGGSLKMSTLDRSKGSIAPGFFVGRNTDGLLILLVAAVLVEDAAANATTYKVKKHHQLKAGMLVAGDSEESKAYAITGIDNTSADHDVVTVGTSLGVALKAGETIFEVKAEDAEGGEYELPETPLGVAKNEIDLSKNHEDTGVSLNGTYTVAMMAFGAPKAFTKHLPLMRFNYPKNNA